MGLGIAIDQPSQKSQKHKVNYTIFSNNHVNVHKPFNFKTELNCLRLPKSDQLVN